MCDKSINTHLSIQFVSECYKTQEMCDKAVSRCFFVFIYILDWYKTQEMCDRVISKDPFMIVYCSDRCKTQGMCDESVDVCLAASKFIPDCYVISRMLEKFHNALLANDDILFFKEDFNKVTFIANQRHALAVDFDEIVLYEDNNFDEDDYSY